MNLAEQIIHFLGENKAAEALAIIEDQTNRDALATVGWDLVPKVGDFLTEDIDKEHPEVLDACELILVRLVEAGNAKEVLLVLLEQLDCFQNDVKFKCLLIPLQRCLQRLPSKKGHSIAISVETLQGHIEALPVPDDQNFEGEERMLLDCDEDVQRINDIMSSIVSFLTPFAKEVSWLGDTAKSRPNSKKQIHELTSHIIKLLDKPMCVLDLSCDLKDTMKKRAKSNSRVSAEQLMDLLTHLQVNYYKAIENIQLHNENSVQRRKKKQQKKKMANTDEEKQVAGEDNDDGGDDIEDELDQLDVEEAIPEMGLAVLAYLVFGEQLGVASVPQLYSTQYTLQFNCDFITILLQKEHSLVALKGLSLLNSLISNLTTASLPCDLLEWKEMRRVLDSLLKVVTTCPVKDICRFGVNVLTSLLQKFNSAGRNKFLYILLSTSPHSGVVGYATQLLKNEIDVALQKMPPDAQFTAANLPRLLRQVFVLIGGAEGDLLEHNERVMGALNLLRYLVLRDKPTENVTGIWDLIPKLQKTYMEVLRMAINMSKAHYEMELQKTKESQKKEVASRRGGTGEPEISFTVGSHQMSAVSKEQQVQVLHTAMHTFDMMESVVGRVNELIEQQGREFQQQ